MTKKVRKPLRTTTQYLPLEELDWDTFENFTLELVKSLPQQRVKKIFRYGKQGSKQRGIDIIAVNEIKDQNVFQSKKYKKYSLARFQEAVKIANKEYPLANEYTLITSSDVGTDIRDEELITSKWNVWDKGDICTIIKTDLPRDKAVSLVNRFFGYEWTNDFLGTSPVSPFISSKKFFELYTDSNRVFHHQWEMVGRDAEIKSLKSFVRSNKRFFLMSGRGGIGKTKIIKDFSDSIKSKKYTLRFIDRDFQLSPETIKTLEIKPYILIVDDAHDRSDLGVLLNIVKRHEQEVKVVLVSRPQREDSIRSEITRAGFDASLDIEEMKIDELEPDDVYDLAKQALPQNYNETTIRRLATLTKDAPLITVIAGQLLRKKSIDPALLDENDIDFRSNVLDKFKDEVVGKLSEEHDPKTAQKVLNLVAILQPISRFHNETIISMANFLGIEQYDLESYLDMLEKNGVLAVRGHNLRIMPDVLSEHLIAKACLNSRNQSTGYSEKVYETFKEKSLNTILLNLSKLDWKVSENRGEKTNLLDHTWNEVAEEIKSSNNFQRTQILKMFDETAFYQSDRVLEIIKWLLKHPKKTPDPDDLPIEYRFDESTVLAEVPKLLREIAFNPQHLDEVLDLLWFLGKGDPRRPNSYPDHAIRVIEDISGYDIGKSVAINKIALDHVEKWLDEKEISTYKYSPFDFIDKLTEKSSYSEYYSQGKITFRSFGIDQNNTREIREKALKICERFSLSEKLPLALRAVKSLTHALSDPAAYFGRQVTKEEIAKWENEQLDIIASLKIISGKKSRPIIDIEIKDSLVWHMVHGKSKKVKKSATALYNHIGKSFDLRLTRALKQSHESEYRLLKIESHQRSWDLTKKDREKLADEFLINYPSYKHGLKVMNSILEDLESVEEYVNPGLLLSTLTKRHKEYMVNILEDLVKKPKSTITKYIFSSLIALYEVDSKKAKALSKKILARKDKTLIQAVAFLYGSGVWVDNPQKEDFIHIETLTKKKDPYVLATIARGLGTYGKSEPKEALKLLLKIDFLDGNVAESVCDQIDDKHGIPIREVTDKQIETLLKKLEKIDDIDNHRILDFITVASKIVPKKIFDFFINRIKKLNSKTKRGDYRPIPYSLRRKIALPLTDIERKSALQQIRDITLNKDSLQLFWLKDLFGPYSKGFDSITIEVLNEWVDSSDKEKIERVTSFLRSAPENFIFTNTEFVRNFLSACHKIDSTVYQDAVNCLAYTAISSSKSGSPFEPFPEDVRALSQVNIVLAREEQGTSYYQLLSKVKEYLLESMERHKRDGEALLDE